MRTSSMIASMAAVVVAGSAMAGAVDTFGLGFSGGDAVNGVVSAVSGTNGTGWQSLGATSDLFGYRMARAYSQNIEGTGLPYSSSSISNNAWSSAFTAPAGRLGGTEMWYSPTASFDPNPASGVDFTGIDTISFTLSGVSGLTSFGDFISLTLYGQENAWTTVGVSISAPVVNGTYTFSITDLRAQAALDFAQTYADFIDQGATPEDLEGLVPVDFSMISQMNLNIYNSGSGGVTVSDFNFTLVPAPGALALLGAAGLMGRRRRN